MSGTHTVMDQGFSIYVPVAVNWAHVIRFTCYGDRPTVVCRFLNIITVQASVPQRTPKLPQENLMPGYRPDGIHVYSLSWHELSYPKLIGSTYVKYSSTHDDLLHVLSSHTSNKYGRGYPCEWTNLPWVCTTYCILYIHAFIYKHIALYICAKTITNWKMHHFIHQMLLVLKTLFKLVSGLANI